MAYIINRFDGTQLTIVDDGILDTSTPVGLIGRNYTGYGEVQNENFIFLLENFANASPPARALSGQAWYDKGAKALKVYNGTTWLSIGNATVSETEPAHSNGGLWLKTTTQQLFVSDGITWRQVGPEAAEGFAVTKMTSTIIKDSLGTNKPAILSQINGETTAIIVNEDFIINAATEIPGFSQLTRGINLKSTNYFSGALKGNADSATRLDTSRTINSVAFNGTSDITITAATNQPLKAGDFIIGSEFNGSFETTWDINATSENLIGTVVSRNSVGGFTATIINSDLFGDVQGNVTAVTGTSTFNEIVVNNITGETFSGLAARTTRLATPRLINTVPFNGTEDITLPVPAETLVGTTLASNVVDSLLTSLGKLVALEVEAPGIVVGDGNNLNIKIEGFTPTLESDVSNAIKLKLLTGSVTVAPTTITFVSANAASADGVLSPAFVPDYTLSTPANQRPVLGLPSHRWKDIYSAAATLDVLKTTTLSGRTVADEVTVSNKLIVNGGTYSALFGNVTGNLTGNVTGAASLNMLKSGDSMSGDLSWTTTGRGLSWSMNTDTASIRYYNSTDNSTDNRLEFNTSDNLDEYFRWTHTTGGNTFESMRLTPTAPGIANLQVTGQITVTSGVSAATYIGNANQLTNLNATQLLTGTIPTARLAGTYNINIAGNVSGNVTGNLQGAVTGNVTGNVTGSASLNVLKTGDALTGDLNWSTTGRGLTWGMNTDGASIRFYNTGDGDAASRLEFQTTDNGNEYFSWTHASGSTFESMRLVPNSSGNAALTVFGNATINGTTTGTFLGNGTSLDINAGRLTTGTVPTARLTGTYAISVTGNAGTATSAGTATNQAGGSVNATTGSFSGRIAQSISGFHAASKEVISTRTDSGFYDWPNPTTANGWPVNSSWYHLLSSTHVNDANYYAMQFSADFYGQNLYYRSTAGSGATAWNKILHSTNFNDYAPTKAGAGANGTWNINITGSAGSAGSVDWNAISGKPNNFVVNDGGTYGINVTGNSGTATSSRFVQSPDGDRNPNNKLPITSGQSVRFDFASAGYVGTGGNYAGVMTYAPWTGTTSSTGDASYQLAFGSTATNGNGTPQLRIRKGIDSSWNSWYDLLTSANYNSYSPTLTGGNASGTWGINITGNAGSVSAISYQQVVNALGYPPANQSDLTRVTTSPLQATNITTTGTLTVAQDSDKGLRWPNDAFGGGGDTASITLETSGRSGFPAEATRMVLRVTNDAGLTGDKIAFDVPDANSVGILNVANQQVYPFYNWLNIAFTRGVSTSTSGFTNQVGSWNFGANYFDVYPPESYTMAHLVAFIPSIYIIHFAGGVDGNDSLICTWSNLGDRIRVYVQNTEQRSTPGANWLAIWRIPLP